MNSPLFSVIVPTYDRPRFLADAVNSILNQTVADFECIVVDDAGPNRAQPPKDPRVRSIRHELNGGVSVARNTGLQAARGRYVAFLDDDDVFTPRRLEFALRGLERAPATLCLRADMDGRPVSQEMLEGNVHDRILNGMTPHYGQVAIERERVPRFDARFEGSSDIDWWLRLTESTLLSTVPEVGLRYRTHSGARHRNGTDARVVGGLQLLDIHGAYFEAHRNAAAFRWRRIGIMAMSVGDRSLARRALVRSLRLHPTPRTMKHLLRALRPTTERVSIPEALEPLVEAGRSQAKDGRG